MQAVALAQGDRGRFITAVARDYEQPATVLRLPPEGIHQRPTLPYQGFHIQNVWAQVKDGVAWAQAEIVHRAGRVESQALAIAQLRVRTEAVDMQPWLRGGEGDTEVEQLTRGRVKLRVRREGADLVQARAEGEHPARFKRQRIEFPRQTLFTERQEPPTIGIDADVDRRLERRCRA